MLLSVRRPACRLLIVAALALLPTAARAQDATLSLEPRPTPVSRLQELSFSAATIVAEDAEVKLSRPPHIVQKTTATRRGALLPLYASFATLQVLDGHSTLRAIRAGGEEQNPLMRGIADRPAALFAVKAGVTASTIFLTEKLRVKNRTGAIVLMAALNSVYAVVVAHNYRAAR